DVCHSRSSLNTARRAAPLRRLLPNCRRRRRKPASLPATCRRRLRARSRAPLGRRAHRQPTDNPRAARSHRSRGASGGSGGARLGRLRASLGRHGRCRHTVCHAPRTLRGAPMRPMAILAAGVISPLGEGAAGYAVGELGARPETRVAPDRELTAAGLRRPNAARAPLASSPGVDRAGALLRDLERVRPDFRELRLGLVLGTSSGGLGSLTELLAARARGEVLAREQALSASYFGPLRVLERFDLKPLRVTQVLAACASSTVAMGIACRWLEADACDLVIAGGYDALTTFAAAGFEALGATTASVP